MNSKEYGKIWRANNQEKIIKWRKEFCRVNKDKLRIMDREVDFGGNWKKALDRDNWTCRHCGKDLTKYRPNVHHKDNKGHSVKKKKADNSLKNLVSLCVSCHRKLHINLKRLEQKNEL